MFDNSMANQPWVEPGFQTWFLVGFTLASLIAFVYALWHKLLILSRAAPENRFDRFWDRMVHTLRVAAGQEKLFKRLGPGWMHAIIFWGFGILALSAGQFFFIGF